MQVPPEHIRIDKWLWAVRLYKSRTLATVACNAGHVKIAGQAVKASREIHVGEIIRAQAARVNRTVKVLQLLDQRVNAKQVGIFLEDQTPPEEYVRAREEAAQAKIQFPKGFGRPTKKRRRQMDDFFEGQAGQSII